MYEPIEETLIANLSLSGTPLLEGKSLLSIPFTVEDKVDTVLQLLKGVVLFNDYSKQVTIHTLDSSEITLKSPVTISICYQEGQYYAELFELNITGVGVDEHEAISDFKLNLLDLYTTLGSLSEDELGPEPLKWKLFFNQYISKNENK